MASGTIKAKTTLQASINTTKQTQAVVASGGGSADHTRLFNRDKENQHPISAITGLQKILDGKLNAETVMPLIEDAAKNKAVGLFYDINKELAKKSYWYLTSKIDPVTKMGTKDSVISGPYDLGMGGGSGGSGSGGSGGVTTITLSKSDPDTGRSMWPNAIALGSKCEISVYWTSLKESETTGAGVIYLYVNNTMISKKTYSQGIVKFDISNYILSGDNKIEVKIQDVYSTTKNLIGNITGVTLSLESTFDDTIAYASDIPYTYKAFGDVDKMMHFVVDDEELPAVSIKTTGETSTYSIKNLSHGSHTLLVYFTAILGGEIVESNRLFYDLIRFVPGNSTPIIASTFSPESEQEQYVSFNIPYRVYTPGKNTSSVELFLNQVKYGETLDIDQAPHLWAYRPLELGDYTLEIRSGGVSRIFKVHTTASRVQVELSGTNLVLALNADGRSNSEPIDSRLKWEDKERDLSCTLTGFNWSSNGWMTDENDNPILRLAGSARVEIPYQPFAKDFTQTGKTFEFQIATRDIKAYDTMIMQCLDGGDAIDKNVWLAGEDDRTKKFTINNLDEAIFLEKVNNEYGSYVFTYKNGTWTLDNDTIADEQLATEYGIDLAQIDLDSSDPSTEFFMEGDRFAIDYKVVGIGFYLTPQLAKLQAQQTSLSTQYKEDDNVRLTFVIENRQEHRLVYMYINGIMSGVTRYPASESFRQSEPKNIIIGSPDATVDIYNLRIYDIALSRKQVVNNWIADTQDVILKADRYYNNDNYDETGNIVINKLPGTTPYMTLTAEKLPSYKKDKKPVDVAFVYPADETRSFTSTGATADVQGTSSQYYYRKNFKIKFENGFLDNNENLEKKYKIQGPVSKKEKTFTFKADMASSEGTNNVELVRYFEDTKNWYSPAELAQDPDDTIDGYDTKDRIRVGIDGFPMVMFHNDGVNTKFYGKMNFNNDKANDSTFGFIEGDECWEFTNNSSKLVLFKTDSLDDWENSFESRYPEDVADANGVEHVFGTAVGELNRLQKIVSWINSTDRTAVESEAEKTTRLNKFRNELTTYFDQTSALFYYLYTELFLMVDSRAKNAMLAYYKSRSIGDGGDKWFWIPYDMDTALGINNEGLLVFDYDVEDTDLVHGANVYNGQQSVFWNNIRDAFPEELAKMYSDLRAHSWSFASIEKRYADHQAVWSESIFNEDSYTKYLEPLVLNSDASYLGMAQGSKAEQRRWWLFNRFRYLDSKYRTGDAADQNIMLRVYQKGDLTITPYINCHVTAIFDQAANYVTADAERNIPVVLESPVNWNPNNSDAVLAIYSADMLKDIGDLSAFKPGYANFSAATKLQRLKIGSTVPGYTNEKLTGIMVGNNHLLTEIDARNCTNLGYGDGSEVTSTIDLSGCVSIERAFFDNTKVIAVQFPVGGYLQEVHLPGSITNLEIRNHPDLRVLKLDGTNNLKSLWLENISSESIDAYSIISQMNTGGDVRLIGIDNTMDTAQIRSFYDKLDTMVGKDIHGDFMEKAQVTGQINVEEMAYADLMDLKDRYPEVYIKVKRLICTVRFLSEGKEFNSQNIILNGDALDPGIPEKAPNQAEYYTFNSWDDSFLNIQKDMEINAVYDVHVQRYTVKFNTASDLIDSFPPEETVDYNTVCHQPTLSTLPENVEFLGWFTPYGTLYNFEDPVLDHLDLTAYWNDTAKPNVRAERLSHNTFKIIGTDNLGITSWAVSLKDETPKEWTDIYSTTQLSIDYTVQEAGVHHVFIRDLQGNLAKTSIEVLAINSEIKEGFTSFNIVEGDQIVNSYAIIGTSIGVDYIVDDHYESPIVLLNGMMIDIGNSVQLLDSINTVEATTTRKNYKIMFEIGDHGHTVDPQIITYKHTIIEPDPQTADGWITEGWYLDKTFLTKWNFERSTVEGVMTLYARWIEYHSPTIITINVEEELTSVTINYSQSEANGASINWGDGSFADGSVSPGTVSLAHTYIVPGEYKIQIARLSGATELGRSYTSPAVSPASVIRSVEFAFDITTTAGYAFKDAVNLTEINLTRYMTTVAAGAFEGCTGVTKLVIPKNIREIGPTAFQGLTSLTAVSDGIEEEELIAKLPEKLVAIGDGAFEGCSKIKQFVLPDTLITAGMNAFKDCTALTTVNIPAALTHIPSLMFSGCTSLPAITIPTTVVELGYSVFEGCSSLEKVIFMNSSLTIGAYCFDSCPLLTSAGPIGGEYQIEFAWDVAIPAKAFYCSFTKSALVSCILPDTIKSIGEGAFFGCSELTALDLPYGLESIGDQAFFRCMSLTTMTIPPSATSLGTNIFWYCIGLALVNIYPTYVTPKVTDYTNSWFWLCNAANLKIQISKSIKDDLDASVIFGEYWNYVSEEEFISFTNEL